MKKHEVHCSKTMAHVTQAWAHIRDFGSSWHPDIVTNQSRIDATGAVVREFNGADGGTYREQITYFSDTDQLLRYALTEGIDDIEGYRGEVSTTSTAINWSATFTAPASIGPAVAAGTKSIFDNGLDWLSANATATREASPSTRVRKSNARLRNTQIHNAPHLSVLSAIEANQSCWTLVLFVHGIGGNASNWQAQLETLAGTHHVAALDLRGYGNSKPVNQQTRIDDYCNDILKVMQHFDARKLVIVGLSMGSWIATSFAMRHPQLLAGLVLAGGCTGMSEADADERNQFLQARATPLSQGKTPAEFADDVVSLIAGPTATDEHRTALHASMSAIASATYLDALTCFCNPVERFDYARIDCPVLLLTGEHDRLASTVEIRQVSLNMYDAIDNTGRLPDIGFEVIDDAGHLCNLEQPELFNHHLLMFLNRIPGATRQTTPTRESRRQLKSRLILDAALEEFSAQGFDGVSMTAIAKRAGVSKPTLYQYFGDKDGLFANVLQEGCDHIMTPLSAPDGSLVDRLWDFSWTYANFVLRADMLSLARLVLGEASRRPDVAGIYHDAGPGKAFQGLIAFMQECVDARQLDVDDLEYAAQDLWSLILSGPRDYHLHFVNEQPDPAHLLRSIGHGLQVFLKVYSTNRATDLEALAEKITAMNRTLTDNLRVTKQ